tara:strand:+ start:3227 stop:4612 length:1386 start_codon:yes stop_codon:yes gene_type:complete
MDTWVKDKDLSHATIGFKAVKVNSRELIGEYNSNLAIVPASNLKLLTTAAALEIFGPDKKFETALHYTGKIEKGVLYGDLILKGGGDPSLGSKYNGGYKKLFASWTQSLKNLGIHAIEGSVIADASLFPDYVIPRTWIWEDIGNYYGCGVSALSFIDNTFHISFSSSNTVNAFTTIEKMEPEVPFLTIDNQVRSSHDNRDNAYLFGGPYNFNKRAEGTIPKGRSNFKVKGSLPDPALQLAYMFRQELISVGIEVKDDYNTIRRIKLSKKPYPNAFGETKRIAAHNGLSVRELVKYTNMNSVNLYAEHLNCLLGLEKYNRADGPSGNKVVKEFLESKKLPLGGVNLVDGSGMSRFNTVTADLMTSLLVEMDKSGQAENFKRSLAVSGQSGTFKSFLNSPETKGLVKGKSGYMERVRSYSGYIELEDGPIAFSIIVNNYSCSASAMKRKIESLLRALIEHQKG